MIVSRAIAVGHYLPERIVENAEFEKTLETSDAWIRKRTGIERRHFAAEGELTSDLATRAAQDAFERFSIDPRSIDTVIVATSTPDQTFPATATRVQANLGLGPSFAFDLQAVCAGFIFGLANADAFIKSGQSKRLLLIGAETFSRILDFEDRSTCVLFGDGAGAVILEAQEQDASEKCGILGTELLSDGRFNDLLFVDGGVSSTQTVGVLRMEGQEVFKHAVSKLSSTAEDIMQKTGISAEQIDLVVPHQANIRIINKVVQKLGLASEKIVVTVADHGNTSAASIPLALSVAHREGRVKKNDLLLFEAIGGGFSWGASLMRW